jgi:uncharacterized membrane protein YeiB
VTSRRASLDVTRAVALLGVVALNYHGYLNGAEAFRPTNADVWNRAFSPLTGILTTRFAATFVLVAGMGMTLFMAAATDPTETARRRLILVRRGALLLGVGLVVQWIWPGTILFYYGAYFMIGAALVRWRTRSLVVAATVVTVLSASIAAWRGNRMLAGDPVRWLSPPVDSPRNLLIRTFVDYTHPVIPWIVFVVAGIVLGRHLGALATFRNRLMGISLAALVSAHLVRTVAWPSPMTRTADVVRRAIVSTDPYDRSVGWVVSTLAVALLAFCVVSMLTERFGESAAVSALGNVGSMSLTLYFGHVFFYNVLVRQLGLLGPDGLAAALVLTLLYVVPAFVFASWWKSSFGTGPAERIYRLVGG